MTNSSQSQMGPDHNQEVLPPAAQGMLQEVIMQEAVQPVYGLEAALVKPALVANDANSDTSTTRIIISSDGSTVTPCSPAVTYYLSASQFLKRGSSGTPIRTESNEAVLDDICIGNSRLNSDEFLRQMAEIYYTKWHVQIIGDIVRNDVQMNLVAGSTAAASKQRHKELIYHDLDAKQSFSKERIIEEIIWQFRQRINTYPQGQIFSFVENNQGIRQKLDGRLDSSSLSQSLLVTGGISMFLTTLWNIVNTPEWVDLTDGGTLKNAHYILGNIGVCPAVSVADYWLPLIDVSGTAKGLLGKVKQLSLDSSKLDNESSDRTRMQLGTLDGIIPFSKYDSYRHFLDRLKSGGYFVARDKEGNYFVIETEGDYVPSSILTDTKFGTLEVISKEALDFSNIPQNYLFLRNFNRSNPGKLHTQDMVMHLHKSAGAVYLMMKPDARDDPRSLNYCIVLAYVHNPDSDLGRMAAASQKNVVLKDVA